MSKILYTSDIHASDTHLSSMLSTAEREGVDCIIIGGDIVPHTFSGASAMGILSAQAAYLKDIFIPVIKDFKQRRDVTVYLDLGNDDFMCNRKILEEQEDLFRLLHFTRHRLSDAVDIIGYMVVPPTPFAIKDWEKPDSAEIPHAPGTGISVKGYKSKTGDLEETLLDLASDDTIEKDLDRISEDIEKPFIFISHSPPYDTPLDVIYSGQHVGSLSIKRLIEKWSREDLLIASFHGHIHESPNRTGAMHTKVGNALCINPGQGNGMGAEFQCYIFELSGSKVFPNPY